MGKGNSLPHIAMQVFNNPLMIQPAKLDVILNLLGDRIGLEGDNFYISMSEEETREMAKNSSMKRTPSKTEQVEIAVIPILGTLVHRSTGFDGWSGLRSYQTLEDDIMAAANDPNISAILLDVDSPGGAVSGVFDLEKKIREAKEKKPIYAYVNENSYSAGYLLTSPANKVFMPASGGVGGIGVRMVHVDVSEKDKNDGIKVTNLYVGERKVDFDPHSPLSEEAKKDEMLKLNKLYDMFVERVAENRNLSIQDVRNTEAGTFLGEQAVKMGLADEIMSFDEAIEFIVDDVAARKEEGKTPSAKTNKEEGNMFKTLSELKAESPELHQKLLEEAKTLVRADLEKDYEGKESNLLNQVKDLKASVEEQKETILSLKEENMIRKVQETKKNNDKMADLIWETALLKSEIPEGMHADIKEMVNTSRYIKDDVLDEEAFQKAVDGKIEQWEGKGIKSSILGSGYGRKSGENEEIEEDAETEKKDNEWTANMLELSGDTKAAQEVRKEVN